MFFGVAGGVEPPKASPNLTLQTASVYRLNLRPNELIYLFEDYVFLILSEFIRA